MPSRAAIRRRRAAALTALVLVLLAAYLLAGRPSAVFTSDRPAEADTSAAVERSASSADSDAGPTKQKSEKPDRTPAKIRWRDSVPVGTHAAGSLKDGVLMPAEGKRWVSWDPILKQRPNREWRRWGTDRLVRKTLRVLRDFGAAHPNAPRVAVGDLSRPEGGDFGPQFGSIGHASHQNGLDVDIYYPRKDDRVRPPERPDQVRLDWAQELVDRFVAVGAEKVFVGPSLGLEGAPDVVVPLANHDNHLHFRLPLP